MRVCYDFFVCLLAVSLVGALEGEVGFAETESEFKQLTDQDRKGHYSERSLNQGFFNVTSSFALSTAFSDASRFQSQEESSECLKEERAAGFTSNLSHNNGDGIVGGCFRGNICVPLVICAPFFEEVIEKNLRCLVSEEVIGACCRVPKEGLFRARALKGFSDIPKISFDIQKNPFVKSQLASAIQEGIAKLNQRDRMDRILQRKGIVVNDPRRPEYGHLQFFKTSKEAVEISRAGLVQIDAARSLRKKTQLGVASDTSPGIKIFSAVNTKMSSTCPTPPRCGLQHRLYRTSDGSCNNLQNPEWGQSLTGFGRFLAPKYEDDISTPRWKSVRGGELPSARLVSSVCVLNTDNPSSKFSLSVMQWGQFIDHDLTHAPIARFDDKTGIECCDEKGQLVPENLRHTECFHIPIPTNDSFYSKFGRQCMNFVRTMPAPLKECTLGYREQMNQITHFLDGSAVYGSTQKDQNELRNRIPGMGLLKSSKGELLPPDRSAKKEDCFLAGTRLSCFLAGDSRVNEQPHLSVIHTIWVRQHNRIARKLSRVNRSWSDEKTFQETRKIIVAQIQHIVYNEWLPIILGLRAVEKKGLLPRRKGFTFNYNKFLDPSIRNEFATVAFRFGHSMVEGDLKLFNSKEKNHQNLKLFKVFNHAEIVYKPNKVDQILRGLTKQPMQCFDNFVVDDLTNRLFQTDNSRFGLDLVALNIQRGRDHGIPSYNDVREACGMTRVKSFTYLRRFIKPTTVEVFERLYKSVDDIDAFLGGIFEDAYAGGLVGPTFNCIIRDQFARLKFGDRFYYENGGMSSSFTAVQLKEIRKISWARIVCDNSENIKKIQPLALQLSSRGNPKTPCASRSLPKFNLRPWVSSVL